MSDTKRFTAAEAQAVCSFVQGGLVAKAYDLRDMVKLVAAMFKDRDTKIVAKTTVGDAEVSTVWLGLDHSFGFGGPPLIFETMIFGGPLNEDQERYATEEQALAGHEDMVKRARYAHSARLGEAP